MSRPKTIKIEFDEVYRETHLSYCIVIDDVEYWLPKSQVILSDDKKAVFMAEWLAIDKELI